MSFIHVIYLKENEFDIKYFFCCSTRLNINIQLSSTRVRSFKMFFSVSVALVPLCIHTEISRLKFLYFSEVHPQKMNDCVQVVQCVFCPGGVAVPFTSNVTTVEGIKVVSAHEETKRAINSTSGRLFLQLNLGFVFGACSNLLSFFLFIPSYTFKRFKETSCSVYHLIL